MLVPDGIKSPNKRISRVVVRLHRWFGLLIGLQLLLWALSGVVMSWFHINLVRGETYATEAVLPDLAVQIFASPGGVIAQAPGAKEVQLTSRLGRTVYVTKTDSGVTNLFDAKTGEKLSPLREKDARLVAERDYAGEAKIKHARLLTKAPSEYRDSLPVWQVQYNDKLATRLYVSPGSGVVVSRRNKIWRLYDFFWMLHIMDYDERENYNNPLVKFFSATTLLFILTGFVLIIMRLAQGQYGRDVKSILSARHKPKI